MTREDRQKVLEAQRQQTDRHVQITIRAGREAERDTSRSQTRQPTNQRQPEHDR